MRLPVKVAAQETNISFTQNENGYFMNLDLKLEFPVQDLVDSLILCGSDLSGLLAQFVPQEPPARSTSQAPVCATPHRDQSLSDSGSTTCDNAQTPDGYSMKPFPKIDSPYKSRGRWQANKATYFKREHKGGPVMPVTAAKQLSANAPVFTPSFAIPMASPFSQCSLAASADEVWELPGLSHPVLETLEEPVLPSALPEPRLVQSILQRGLSNSSQCRQM